MHSGTDIFLESIYLVRQVGTSFYWTGKKFTYPYKKKKSFFLTEATPIYLLVLRAQEVGNEPFWNKRKS